MSFEQFAGNNFAFFGNKTVRLNPTHEHHNRSSLTRMELPVGLYSSHRGTFKERVEHQPALPNERKIFPTVAACDRTIENGAPY